MKGAMKEILYSFIIGIGAFGFAVYLNQEVSTNRNTPASEPTVYQTISDQHIELNWGLERVGATAPGKRSPSSVEEIVVAIIDTGCDIEHPLLRDNIWTNPGEVGIDENGNDKATNGIDDDGNGYADDVHGWNFVDSSPALMDEHGHGTHVAGITRMVAPHVRLMILKYYDTNNAGMDNLTFTVAAIRYATRMGANIINYSGGGWTRSQSEERSIREASEKGVLFIAAAGNEGLNSDFQPFYPADYELPNIVSVGATDRSNQLISASNFGYASVDLAAPGKNIYSALPNGQYGYLTGTSQATAFVSGAMAIALERNNQTDPILVKDYVLALGTKIPALTMKVSTGSLLNVREYASKFELADLPNSAPKLKF